MYFPQIPVLAVVVASALANPIELSARGTPCTNGAVVYAVRGSDPQQTTLGYNPRYSDLPQGMTDTANAVIQKAGGNSYLQPISYPAINPAEGGDLYSQSVQQGVQALQAAIGNYIKSCAHGDIFVLGYSQGGQVTSDALAGSSANQPLANPGRLTGGVIFADPTYTDGYSPVDAGSGANDGQNGVISDPTKYAYLNSHFAKRVRSYCQAGDEYCDSGTGPNATQIHLNAPEHFESAAIAFLKPLV